MFSISYSGASTVTFLLNHLILGECKSSNGSPKPGVHLAFFLLPPMLVDPGRNLSKVDAVAREIMDAACRLCLSKTAKCLSGWELYFVS